MEKGNKARCPICDNHQDIWKSQAFLNQTMEDRSKTLDRKRLYYRCFCEISLEQNAKSCGSERLHCKTPHSI